jgi:DNA-binding SARP family transcriptional activator
MQRDHVIGVLGPIELLTPAGAVSVGGRKARAVLGVLVVGAGHCVSFDLVKLAAWGDAAPPSADEAVHTYVSRLRHLLGADAIELVDHGYRLTVDRRQIDVLQFQDLLTRATELRAQPQECRDLCRAALALWRGEPFGDLADDEAFRLEAMRLEELRLATMELALEAELALGHHELVAAELESAVSEHPYREPLRYLLIEALMRSDRRIDAARVCDELRQLLTEAGLEPGEHLRELEARILGGEDDHEHDGEGQRV